MSDDGALRSEIGRLREELAAVRAELALLRGRHPSPDARDTAQPAQAVEAVADGGTATRRQLLRHGALAVGVGVAGVGVAGRPVAALDGDPVLLGQGNDATNTTQITASAPGTTALAAQGAATGVSRGVSGSTASPEGTGVVGEATSGTGSAIGVRGESGAPSGAGVYAQNLAASGTAVGMFATTNSPDGVGILGQVASGGTSGAAVRGTQDGATGNGVVGEITDDSSTGAGLLGISGSTDGFAAVGFALRGTGVRGIANEGVGGRFGGARAALRLESSGPNPVDGSDEHTAGEIYFDDDSNLWLCVEAGAPGFWTQLNAGDAPATVPLEPFRAYDSRFVDGPLLAGDDRVVAVHDRIDVATGAIVGTNLVPPGALAVMFNLTIVNTVGAGFVTAAPGDASEAGSSTINWASAGVVIANGSMSKLDSNRQLRIFAGGAPGSRTDVIVDVTAYLG